MSEATVTVTEPKRAKIADRVYVSPSGESRNANPDSTALNFKFANGKTMSFAIAKFPVNVQKCFAWHGLSQKIGDSFASAKGNIDEAIENVEALVEVLMAGTWVEKGEGVGAAPSLVLEAVIRALKAEGQVVDDARVAKAAETLKIKEKREGALKDPKIAAAYAAIRAERAVAKAKEAAVGAKGSSAKITDF